MPTRKDPPARRYVAQLPRVGQGMLDTLQALYGPFDIDTVRVPGGAFAEMQPGRNRMIVNPDFIERVLGMPEGSRRGGVPKEDIIPLTLAHEAIGHGMFGRSETQAEDMGRAFVRATRNPELPYQSPREMGAMGKLLRLLRGL